MRQPSHSLNEVLEEVNRRDRAVAALLYLGEKLRTLSTSAGGQVRASAAPPPEATRALLRSIEGDIIPRLMLAHAAPDAEPPAAGSQATLRDEDHEAFLAAVMTDTARASSEIIATLLRRGVPRETIFIDLLGSCARRLGELWEEDRCDFADVTIGLCRLHEALREHSVLHESPPAELSLDPPSVLLATACDDQHVFGVVMVAEFFRRAGWRVCTEPGASRDRLSAVLAAEGFDLLGLSASCSTLTDGIASNIESLRKASTNTALRVMVGGRLFAEDPGLAGDVGADEVAVDAQAAPSIADALVGR